MKASTREETLRAGTIEVHPSEGLALVAGRPLTLSVRELGLLTELVRRVDRVVSREELFGLVWGGALRPGDRSVDVYVHKLRSKLEEADPDARFIHTHVGFGYRLSTEGSNGLSHPFHTRSTGP